MSDSASSKVAIQQIWEAMAAGWDARHAYLEEVTRPVTERMLARVDPSAGQTILELAGGTGVVGFAAAAAVRPGGRVIVSDFAEAMVDSAAARAAELGIDNVECRVLDAERIDLPDDAVDGALCRWGYMLMPDPAAALAETRRVLRPGGRLSFAVFSGPQGNPWAALPAAVLQEAGHLPPPAAGAPGILALADQGRVRELCTGAGFSDPEIEEVRFTWRFADADDYWEFLISAAGAIAMVLERLDDDERARVREEIAGRVAPLAGAGGFELGATALVVSAA